MSLDRVTRWVSLALHVLAVLFSFMTFYETRSPASALVVISMLLDILNRK